MYLVCHEVSQIHREAVKKLSMAWNLLEMHHSCLKPVHACIDIRISRGLHDLRTSEHARIEAIFQPNHWDDLAEVDSNFSHTVTAWVIQHSHLMEHNEHKRIKTFWWFWAVKFDKNVILIYFDILHYRQSRLSKQDWFGWFMNPHVSGMRLKHHSQWPSYIAKIAVDILALDETRYTRWNQKPATQRGRYII